MPYLGDYLGQLLSEISMARMHADLETVRLAELYAAHPLLRAMPVPHMRLPDVDLDIPVLIKASEEPRADESARGGPKLADMRRKFEDIHSAYLLKAGIALSPADRKKLRAALDERVKVGGGPIETSIDVHRVADDLMSTALRVAGDLPSGLKAEFTEEVRREFLNLRTQPPRLSVVVTSADIRESGTPENLTRLRLKVSEQGVEWTTIESDGVLRDRLVPE